MILRPANIAELSEAMAEANAKSSPVTKVELTSLARVLEYHPEDLTVTVQTGITLGALQSELTRFGQWLPVDPPHAASVTIDEILNENLSGPHRFGYGTIREHLLGITAVLADGRVIHNGGKVVKNVAGFDLCKLFVGSHWSLGIMVEATFKLWPKPAEQRLLSKQLPDLSGAQAALRGVLDAPITPVVLDLFSTGYPKSALLLALAGTAAEVEWQVREAARLGIVDAGSLEPIERFWAMPTPVRRASVPASRVTAEIESLEPEGFVARAGNGVIYYRGGKPAPVRKDPEAKSPEALNRRVKEIFDPKNILPRLPE